MNILEDIALQFFPDLGQGGEGSGTLLGPGIVATVQNDLTATVANTSLAANTAASLSANVASLTATASLPGDGLESEITC